MPAPVGLLHDSQLFFLSNDEIKDDNLLYTLYATNRRPYSKLDSSLGYTIFPSNTLELGLVVYSVGDDDMSWEDLYKQSIKSKRDKELLLIQTYVEEGAQYNKNDDLQKTTVQSALFFEDINKALGNTFDKDLTIYVHGANSNFYRATAQGAQYFHYTGHNSIVLTFSWPSAENLLKYKTDVLHAKQTIPAFARLIEILARHTNARNINILAYSAGAQVVAPGLAYLRDLHPEQPAEDLKKQLRIGEVYFAAPDTAFQPFLERYLKFKDIVHRTTINLNANDRILRMAAWHNGVSRLGRPDITELTAAEQEMILETMESQQLDVIDVGRSTALKMGSSHDSWYSHPWVSNDLLLLFLFNDSPKERGLNEHYTENGARVYIFPENYEEIIKQLIDDNKGEIWQKTLHNQEGIK